MKKIILIFVLTFVSTSLGWANPLIGKYKTSSGESEVSVDYGFSNFGTDDEPEIVFGIFIDYGNDDDVEEMLWFSENAYYAFELKENFLSYSDLAIVRDCYYFRPAGSPEKIIRIGVYGANIPGKDFIPQFILVTLYSAHDGKTLQNIWIPYNADDYRDLHDALDSAITSIGMKKIATE